MGDNNQERVNIFDPCPKCHSDAWCHQTLKEFTAKGTRNPYYKKWWTKCSNCNFSRNYDLPPPTKPRDYYANEKAYINSGFESARNGSGVSEPDAPGESRIVNLMQSTNAPPPASKSVSALLDTLAADQKRIHDMIKDIHRAVAPGCCLSPLSLTSLGDVDNNPKPVTDLFQEWRTKSSATSFNDIDNNPKAVTDLFHK